ncbi:hypothetical protein SAMN06296273_2549 [Nitrosomonas ureae]|uniref:Glycoside hydrolase n=1 Tax=Nitrosomonas ureae TaxID=44577 RepID=A0A285C215_9PROT|nr:glycoside hydrolase [Nitrosomonas ureae]SNX61093.1 hypothetical protein SAMN06296273_2549 [Nitrosomonas ureae]
MKTNDQLLVINSITPNTSTRVKPAHILAASLLLIISMVLAPLNVLAATTDPTAVKWHPGHYYTIMSWGNNNSTYLSQVYSEIKATPALRGIQMRYLWAELEKSKGVYDFSSIDKRLAELTARDKRLVIQVQTKSFDPNWKLVPDYLKGAAYEGGQFPFSDYGSTTIRGYNIKLWHPQVRDRLIALFKALGERYNSHPYFEGIGMIESAMGQPLEPVSSVQADEFYVNMIQVNQKMRLFFPNTMTIQEVNYPRPVLNSLVTQLRDMGATLSSPDTFQDENGLSFKATQYDPNQGVYNYYSDFSGMMAMAPTVMRKNYENTRNDGTGYVPTVSEILVFARDTLHANYIFWSRVPEYKDQVLEVLNWSEQRNDPAGGLSFTCPTVYTSCAN